MQWLRIYRALAYYGNRGYMDINLLRSLVTASAFVGFISILVWTFWPSRKSDFDEAAQLPFRSE